MKYLVATVATLAIAGPACAQQIQLAPVAEARLRYEQVDQDGLPLKAQALTARARGGLTASSGALSATVVAQGTLAMVDHYFDGLDGPANRPLVADPQNVALYVAQLRYATKGLTVTAGRQVIKLDDERFVGNVAFRDNAQTFASSSITLASRTSEARHWIPGAHRWKSWLRARTCGSS